MKSPLHAVSSMLIACSVLAAPLAIADELYTYTSNPLQLESLRLYGQPYTGDVGLPSPSPVFTVSYVKRSNWTSTPEVSISGYPDDFVVTPTWYIGGSFGLALAPIYKTLEDRLSDDHFYLYHDPLTDLLELRTNVWTFHVGNYLVLGPFEVTWSNYLNPGQWTVTEISPIPEPREYALMLAGLAFIGWKARRKFGVKKAVAANSLSIV